ncbi:MAG: purine nucleoside phosphorylase I, inosine and guanosine-specific [Bacteroidales bacterium]|nr:purine nucleoside phosphorylase I, inosine and guanosine-specific [Bacteroidales bacterium]
MTDSIARINEAVGYIKGVVPQARPLVGIILGSGLGRLGDKITEQTVIPYGDIPGFPVSTVLGHKGVFIFGKLGGKPVVAMQGRFHFYEGYSMDLVTLPVRVMALLGVKYLFVSNAAGGINREFEIGDLMVLKDHINLMPNPLIGPNMDQFGTRFPDMTCPYDREFTQRAFQIAEEEGVRLRKGVYLATSGPSYETPSEIRFFSKVGADAVGMSTVPEVIVARHCSLRVFGMSVITNKANMDNDCAVLNDGADVVQKADASAKLMTMIFEKLIESIDNEQN